MDAIIYTRQSLDSTNEGQAVARQEQACRAYAAERGWTVVDVLSDNSISATTGKRRPGFEAVLIHPVKQVVVWHQDRLLRGSRDLERVLDAGLTVHAVSAGSLDLATPTGQMQARVVAAISTYETQHKAERQRLSNTQRATQGKPPAGGRRAFGYSRDGLSLEPDEAAMVAWCYEQMLAGSSLKGLARALADKGFTTPQGQPWARHSIRYLLTNPRYAGLRVLRGEVVGTGTWPTVVAEDTWRTVQALLADPARRVSFDTRQHYLLTRLASCGRCGGAMATGHTQHHSRVYKCAERADLAVKADVIDAYVTEVIVARLSRPDAVDLLHPVVDLGPLLAERAEVVARLDGLAGAYGQGLVTQSQLITGSETLRARLSALEAALLVQSPQGAALSPLVGSSDARAVWEGLAVGQRRAVVGALFETITLESPGRGTRTFNPERVRLQWRGEPMPELHAVRGRGEGQPLPR